MVRVVATQDLAGVLRCCRGVEVLYPLYGPRLSEHRRVARTVGCMAKAKTWRKRIGEYRASGLSAVKFAEGRDFSAHQVWNWAAKFRKEDEAYPTEIHVTPASAAPAQALVKSSNVRLARLVRVPSQPPPTAKPMGTELSVEMLGIRTVVPRGFDRATFSRVLDEIDAREARAGRP